MSHPPPLSDLEKAKAACAAEDGHLKPEVVVYADGPLMMNALISLGSAKLHNPAANLYLFVKEPERWWFLNNVRVINVDTAFSELCPVDIGLWNKWHYGTSGHMYRKVVAWNWLLKEAKASGTCSWIFLDADTLTEGSYSKALVQSRPVGIGGYWERWQNCYRIYQGMGANLKQDLNYFYCGIIDEEKIRAMKYMNGGVFFVWDTAPVRHALRDLLRISVFHLELASHTWLQEQTLFNIALACRGVTPEPLNDHGLVQGQDSAPGAMLRHWLANHHDRKPSVMMGRHRETIVEGLALLDLDIEMCKKLRLWY